MADDEYTIEGRTYKASTKKEAMRLHEKFKETQLPTFLTLKGLGLDPAGDDRGTLNLEEARRKKGQNNISTCQQVSPSLQKRLKGYTRVRMFPDSPAGKRKAEKAEISYRENAFDVQVRRMYCHDGNPKGNYWTVWVRDSGNPETAGARWSAGSDASGHKSGGTFYARGERRSDPKRRSVGQGRRGWYDYRPEARAKVSCPKCNAPIGESCVTDEYRMVDGTLEKFGKDTNSHRPRVEKYFKIENIDISDIEGGKKLRATRTREQEKADAESLPQRRAEAKARKEARELKKMGDTPRTRRGFEGLQETPEGENPKVRMSQIRTESGAVLGYSATATPRSLGEGARWGGKSMTEFGERNIIIVGDE